LNIPVSCAIHTPATVGPTTEYDRRSGAADDCPTPSIQSAMAKEKLVFMGTSVAEVMQKNEGRTCGVAADRSGRHRADLPQLNDENGN